MCDERKPGDVSELYRSSGISLLSELSVAVIGIEWGLCIVLRIPFVGPRPPLKC